jgi:hypothetical protein
MIQNRTFEITTGILRPGITALLLGLCLPGCGSRLPMGQVSGRVTYDGRPVTAATVEFRPEQGPAAFGSLDNEGRYVLRTKSPGDGVVVGKNVVSVVPVVEFNLLGNRKGKQPLQPSAVPEKYRRGETSGLVREVKPGNNVFDFELSDY